MLSSQDRPTTERDAEMRFLPLLLLLFISHLLAAEPAPIQQWIDEAIKAGGGVVTIPEGVHVLPQGLLIKNAKKLALRGIDKERCILKLPPLAYAECTKLSPAGNTTLPVRGERGWQPGMRLRIECDGEPDSFTKKPRPYVLAIIQEVKPGQFVLKEPLKFPVPAATLIRHEDAPNLIEIREACDTLEIANLTLDGGRMTTDPQVQGHAQLCAIFITGSFNYETGPSGPKPKDLIVRDCIIQNCFGRGVALYSVEKADIARCSFRDICDEAIDFDHFTTGSRAIGNRIIRCRIAFELNDANDCLVEGNEARDCCIGLSLWRWCKQPGLNQGNIARDNSFTSITGNAFQIGTSTRSNRFEDNEIEKPGRNGFSLSGESQVLKNNRIRGAGLKAIAIQEGIHDIQEAAH